MSTDDLARLAQAATPGPWHACEDDEIWTVAPGADCSSQASFIAQIGTTQADAEFIAAASPDAILQLCRERDDLKARLETAERERDDWRDHALAREKENEQRVAKAEADREKLREALRNVHACATYDPARDDCMGCPVRDVLAATAPATTTEPTT